MTKDQKDFFKQGIYMATKYPHLHPDLLIQSEWNRGMDSSKFQKEFDQWHELFGYWMSGVRKGSKYFENN